VSSGESATLTVDTTAATPPGTYTISVVGRAGQATHSFPFTLTVTPITTGCMITNDTNVPIPDAGAAIFSDIAITGCGRAASATAKVEVHIKHTYRGDLRIDLVAPDGTTYRLKNISFFDGGDNVDTTYTVNLSAKAAEGTWRLRVQDLYTADTGFIDSWTIAL
jgi:subtilisin-like proprotein convertase family protein